MELGWVYGTEFLRSPEPAVPWERKPPAEATRPPLDNGGGGGGHQHCRTTALSDFRSPTHPTHKIRTIRTVDEKMRIGCRDSIKSTGTFVLPGTYP